VELLTAVAVVLVIGIVVTVYVPQWWIGVIIFQAFATLPAFVPREIEIAGFAIQLSEVSLSLTALFLLFFRPSNRYTDWCAACIGAITVAGVLYGFSVGNDLAAVMNDSRGLFALSLSVFIVGRVALTLGASVAMKAVKITLWTSFVFVLLGAWGVMSLTARVADVSLYGKTFTETSVDRILGPTSPLASAVLAVILGLWAIKPDLTRPTLGYFIPASGITVIGFSRNAVLLVGLTLLLTPLFHGSIAGAKRAVMIAIGGIGGFVAAGAFLSLAAGVPGFDYLRSVQSAYLGRVVDGFRSDAVQYDYSYVFRQLEVNWLKRSIVDHEFFGNGFGFRYRPSIGAGVDAQTYYAHQFYLWTVAKVGLLGLIGYMTTFLLPVLHSLFGPGRFALRSAAGAALVGYLAAFTVVPIPTAVNGAPVFGALLAIALHRAPSRIENTSIAPPRATSLESAPETTRQASAARSS